MNQSSFGLLLDAFAQDERLLVPENFTARRNALDFIATAEEALQADGSLYGPGASERLGSLKSRLATIDVKLFEHFRTKIRQRQFMPGSLRLELERCSDYVRWNREEARRIRDRLDFLFNGILDLDDTDLIRKETAEPEMVFYEPTPARLILALADHADFQPDDILYDLGSGTGRVPLLLNLISGVRARGVEFDPNLHQLACRSLAALELRGVTFIQGDARTVDYSDGTVFYLFTPFQGAMLQTVLGRLKAEAQKRPIRIYGFGGCTSTIEDEPWLRETTPAELAHYRVGVFHSRI